MELEDIQSFLARVGERVARTRAGLLIVGQAGGSPDDLALCSYELDALRVRALQLGLADVSDRLAGCISELENIFTSEKATGPHFINKALDEVASVEAALLEIPLNSGEFLEDVAGFVDASFENLDARPAPPEQDQEDFDIDEETLEIFRSEADELLAGIAHNLKTLNASPNDRQALWEIRRNAHTFKGAAGIVGLRAASELAHRVEDLLDKMVELQCDSNPQLIALLDRSNARLSSLSTGTSDEIEAPPYSEFQKVISSLTAEVENGKRPSNGTAPNVSVADPEPVRTPSTPIVRVSLDRLDELIRVSHDLVENRTAISTNIAAIGRNATDEDFNGLELLFETQRRLTDEMREKLLRIRMVRFGTLETRLSRAVHVTCQEENKRATVILADPDIEIDTQVIDAMIEPLLHLLKNAVVHGIEPPDTRRLIGKPEKGMITIGVSTDASNVILSVEDDGRGISALKLKEKAIETGLITSETASRMADFETWELIFDRGLTTADKLNLNAGRGIGMNIVRESVESRGGSVSLRTEAQIGTTFTIRMPLIFKKSEPVVDNMLLSEEKQKPLVLVVDDSASIRRHHVKLVEDAGCQAITANDGSEALILLLSGKWEPDLIISDVEMPNMDGWGLLEYIKTDDNFGHIPVIMATSLNADEHINRAAELGASDYRIKPVNAEDIRSVLSNIVEKVTEPAVYSA
ncbi:MAG: response regulator [Pyrinomonadaceae bacterium]